MIFDILFWAHVMGRIEIVFESAALEESNYSDDVVGDAVSRLAFPPACDF